MLAAVAGKLTDVQVAIFVSKYVDAFQKTTDSLTEYHMFSDLGTGLASVASRLTDAQVVSVVSKYVEMFHGSNDYSTIQSSMKNVTSKLNETTTEVATTVLLSALDSTSSVELKAELAEQINYLIPHLAMTDKQSKTWLEICDIPYIDREAGADAIRKKHAEAPAKDQGIWAFLEWANKYYGIEKPWWQLDIFPDQLGETVSAETKSTTP